LGEVPEQGLMLIDIAKPEMTVLYCTPLIHRQLKFNSTTMHRYWILDRRAQAYFEIPIRSVLQHGCQQRLAVDWHGLLKAITSRQHYDDKGRMLAVLSIFVTKLKVYFMQNEAYQPKDITFPGR